MPTEKTGNYQTSLKGGGEPPLWENAKLFPVFSYEGFPNLCLVWFGLVSYCCYSAHHYSRILCDHFAQSDRKRKSDQLSKMGTLSIHRHEVSKYFGLKGEGAKKIFFELL